MRTLRTIAEVRAALAGARPALDRPRPDDGRVSRRPPLADAPRARASATMVVVSLFVNPTQFNDAGRICRLSPRRARDDAARRASGVDSLFAPAARDLPAGFRDHGVGRWADRAARGRRSRPGALRRRHDGGREAAEHGRARTCAYFGQKDAQQALVIAAPGPRPRHAGRGSRSARPCASRRARAARAATRYLDEAERERAAALHRALRAVRRRCSPPARTRRPPPRRTRRAEPPHGIEPDYLAVVDPPTRWRR